MTVSRGEQFYALGGHSLLRIKETNHALPADVAVNWGIFNLNDPRFIQNALFGKLDYRSGSQSIAATEWLYTIEDRAIIENQIYLTAKQKKTILKKVAWWLKEENSVYRYNLFFNNCSTIIRDILHKTFGDEFKENFTKEKRKTFRKMGALYFYQYPFALFAGMFLTSQIDQPISSWEHFIMPIELPKLISKLGRFNDKGQMTEDKLLGPTVKILDSSAHSFLSYDLYSLLISLSLMVFAALGFFIRRKGTSFLKLRILGFYLSLLGLMSTVFSLAMIFIWCFTEYDYMFHNAHLWFFWPFDFAFFLIGMKAFLFNKFVNKERKLYSFAQKLILAHIVCLFLQLALWSFGLIQQDISYFYLYLLGPYTLAALTIKN